ncbi:hypothetical protein [Caproicibacter fermentans]|uniref:hypothetical protein n=1 Tax=Caproicibacter fermentans TaxID=2576756 RepID=UPI0038B2FD72
MGVEQPHGKEKRLVMRAFQIIRRSVCVAEIEGLPVPLALSHGIVCVTQNFLVAKGTGILSLVLD